LTALPGPAILRPEEARTELFTPPSVLQS